MCVCVVFFGCGCAKKAGKADGFPLATVFSRRITFQMHGALGPSGKPWWLCRCDVVIRSSPGGGGLGPTRNSGEHVLLELVVGMFR